MITSFTNAAQPNSHVWVAESAQNWFCSDYAELDYIRAHLPYRARSAGRATVTFFQVNDHRLVLRKGTRGGWMHPVLEDRYLRTGVSRRRCGQELVLLDTMWQKGLPVPEPIAAVSEHAGFFYRYQIITREIPNASALSNWLQANRLDRATWMKVGETIARFHKALVYHADLNASNILLDDDGEVYLIDFDRSCLKASAGDWSQNNLNRLRHSLQKLRSSKDDFHYDPFNFDELMQGYSSC